MQLDIDSEEWPKGAWEEHAHQACEAVGRILPEMRNERLALSVLFTSDEAIRALNAQWRGRDKPTNVLSFPMLERGELIGLQDDGPPVLLGDLALAYETCAREAAGKGISVKAHSSHLLVHGLLHLAGFDHETSDEDADAMEALEVEALAKLGLGNPYRLAD